MPDHEKEVYQEMAHQAKSNKKFQPARYDRMDCTGQLISVRTSCSKYTLRDVGVEIVEMLFPSTPRFIQNISLRPALCYYISVTNSTI